MVDIMFSIPVHEKMEVVIDQIVNYQHFNPGCGIVLHISQGFTVADSIYNKEIFFKIIENFDNVFVNPSHWQTMWGDILHTHISNFQYISKMVDFQYFCLSSSNDLFVREGVLEEMKDYDFGVPYWKLTPVYAPKEQCDEVFNDSYLKSLLSLLGGEQKDIRKGQVEGSYYRKEIFARMIEDILTCYDYKEVLYRPRIIYAREEFYFPTAAYLKKFEKKYDRGDNITFVAWNRGTCIPTIEEINNVMDEKVSIFCMKRFPRQINNPLRSYIRDYIGKYTYKVEQYIDHMQEVEKGEIRNYDSAS